MKKLIEVLLVILMILSLTGCNKQKDEGKEVKRLVVFAKAETNSGLVLFFDEDGQLLFTRECEYPYTLFYDQDAIYVSENGEDYSSLLLKDGSSGRSLKGYKNPISALSDDGYFALNEGAVCKFYLDGTEVCHETFALAAIKGKEYYYYIDNINYLHICDLKSFEEIASYPLENTDMQTFTLVNEEVYIANDNGYTHIDGATVGQTYIYPNDFTKINNILDGMIFFEENNESTGYRISFDKYKMILTPIYNEEYYRQIDFDKEYKEYFEQGYDIVDLYDIGY